MDLRKYALSATLAFALACGLVLLFFLGPWGTDSRSLHEPDVAGGETGTGPSSGGDPSGAAADGAASDAAREPAGEGSEAAPDPGVAEDERPISLTGKVTRAGEGEPVAAARILLIRRESWDRAVDRDRRLLQRDPFEAIRRFRASLLEVSRSLPRAETDAGGVYVVRGLEDGDYRVLAQHEDFLPHRDGEWVRVASGTTAREDIELIPGHRITGWITGVDGRPLEGVIVLARPSELEGLRGIGRMVQTMLEQTDGSALLAAESAPTGADGAFRITSLEPRTYDLRAERDGYAWGRARKVTAGTNDVRITLEPATRIIGRVLDPDRRPLAGVDVRIEMPLPEMERVNPLVLATADIDFLGERTRKGTTDGDGRFQLDSFEPGGYDLVIETEGLPVLRRKVEVEGTTVDLRDIVLDVPRSISGHVLSAGGVPVAGARVELRRSEGGSSPPERRRAAASEVETGADGAFLSAGLPAGTYRVIVSAKGFVREEVRGVEAGAAPLAITLREGMTLAGTVLDAETREPIPGARVRLGGSQDDVAPADAQGRFQLAGIDPQRMRPGAEPLFITVEHDDYEQVFRSLQPGDLEGLELLLRLKKGIEGVVLDDQGRPASGARVSVEVPGFPAALLRFAPGTTGGGEVVTAEDGTFFTEVPRMGPRTAPEIVVVYPGFAAARVGPIEPPQDREPWPFVEVVLSRGSTLTGRVLSTTGAPIPGAQVTARRDVKVSPEALMFAAMLPEPSGEVAYSSADGQFELGRIEPGVYRLEVRALGYARETIAPVEVGTSPAPLEVILDAGGTIAGRVIDIAGEPLAGIEVVAFLEVAGARGSEGSQAGAASGGRSRDRMEEEMLRMSGLGSVRAKTGAGGIYELTHLPGGSFRVVARAPEYPPQEVGPLEPGAEAPDIVLAPYAGLAGRVLDGATLAPIERFILRLEVKEDERTYRHFDRRRQAERPDGTFQYERLAAGEYRLSVDAEDYVPHRVDVRLDPGAAVELEVLLRSGSRIEGVVLEKESGRPIAGAQVTYRKLPAEGVREFLDQPRVEHSGDDGTFAVGGLEDGRYSVRVSHPDHYLDDGDRLADVGVPVEQPAPFEVRMRRAGRLQGTIRNLPHFDRRSSAYLLVLTMREPDRSPNARERAPRATESSIWLQDDGTYTANGLRPGTYQVELVRRYFRRGGEPPQEDERQVLGEVEVRVGEVDVFDASAL